MKNQFKNFIGNLKKIASEKSGLGNALNCLINNLDDDSKNLNTALFLYNRNKKFKHDCLNGKLKREEENIASNRLLDAFCGFVDELSEDDFSLLDITNTGSIKEKISVSDQRKRNLKKQKQNSKNLHWLILPIIALGFFLFKMPIQKIFFEKKRVTDTAINNNKEFKPIDSVANYDIESAFNLLFKKGKVLPFLKDRNTKCFPYEGKWELDSEKPYVITINLGLGSYYYYYKAKSLHFYAWCDKEDTKKLNGIEIFTNELWKDTKRRNEVIKCDSLNKICEENDYVKVANISSLFTDILTISDEGKPIEREGKKIIRYQPTEVLENEIDIVTEVIDTKLGELYKTNCNSVTYHPKNKDGKAGIIDSTIIQFNCVFESIDSLGYEKRIVYKGRNY